MDDNWSVTAVDLLVKEPPAGLFNKDKDTEKNKGDSEKAQQM